MRVPTAAAALLFAIHSFAFADVSQLWTDLCAKRQALTNYHQEFDRTQAVTVGHHVQTSKRSTVVDGSRARWRERIVSGVGGWSSVFDGTNLFHLEASEYTSDNLAHRKGAPEPEAYDQTDVDLKKGVEAKRLPCALSELKHECIALDFPVKPRNTGGPDDAKVTAGVRRVMVDSNTGLVMFSQTIKSYERRGQVYRVETTTRVKRMSWNGPVDEAIFGIPAGYTKVKELSRWDAKKMRQELTGKPAPDMTFVDIDGKLFKLSDLHGKTVLLDFWTTWCGPCRADAPSLDKLEQKFGDKQLQIIGVSVDEDRGTVSKFLSEHPHAYPIALTTENEMPRAYQIGVFPTYVIIDSDGNFADATEGDSGFTKLKKLLKRAGMDTE